MIVEKGEIGHFEQFHLFRQCFPKALFFLCCNEYIWRKGLTMDLLQSNKDWEHLMGTMWLELRFLAVEGFKTLWKRKKILVTSIFFLFHIVFIGLLLHGH